MNKLLFLLLILLISGGIFWHFQFNLNPAKEFQIVDGERADLLSQENSEINSKSDKAENIPFGAATAEADNLKALAAKLIERPIIVEARLSDGIQKQAIDKLHYSMSVIQQNYDYPNAWLELGAYRKLIGDYEGAIEAWDFVGLIRPQDHISFSNLGDLYAFYLKDYKKGEENFLKAIANNSGNINSYLQLATLYEYAYEEKSAEAENILLLGIKSNPGDIILKTALAQYYRDNNKISEALKYFEEALALDPSNSLLQEEINKLKNS